MKIGIDAHMLGQKETGNETYIRELVRALAQQPREDIYFVYVQDPAAAPAEVHVAPHMRVVSYATRSSAQRLLRELPKRAALDELDVLHTSYNAPLQLPPRCKLVVTIHDLSFEHYPEWFPLRVRRMLKWSVPRSARAARQVITVSDWCKQQLVQTYRLSPAQVSVTHEAAETRFRPLDKRAALDAVHHKYNTGDHFILAVGNLQPRKNQTRLLSAFGRAKTNGALPHKLVIVGQPGWHAQQVFDGARTLGDNVVFTGYVPEADLPLLYNAAKVFCYPSLYEGFGLPVVEAMQCGAPVITSNVSALPEVAGKAAQLVDPYDVDALAQALCEIANSPARQAELRAAGLAQAGHYSWTQTALQTAQIYHHAAARHARQPTYTKLQTEIRD